MICKNNTKHHLSSSESLALNYYVIKGINKFRQKKEQNSFPYDCYLVLCRILSLLCFLFIMFHEIFQK